MKILATCGNGMGTSLLMEMRVKNVMDQHNIDYEISHTSLGEAKSIGLNFDVIFCPQAFANELNFNGVKVIPLKNVLSNDEIEEKCIEHNIF